MKLSRKKLLRKSITTLATTLALASTACTSITTGLAQPQSVAQQPQADAADNPFTVLELLYLKEDGGGIEAANEYFEWLDPIASRHGVTFDASYTPEEVLAGDIEKPDFIFVITFPSPETVQAVQTDPEYAANIPNRNQIFDFDSGTRTVFKVSKTQ